MTALRAARHVPSYAGVALVLAYRYTIGLVFPASCKYHPSCSGYAVEALKTHGVLRGGVLTAWRLLRCNPWSDGGVDQVADQKLFEARR